MKTQEFLESNGIDVEHGLELLGDMEMYNETLEDFLTESETRLPNILKYKNEADMPNYAILVHAMKSDSKYLGFKELAEIAVKQNKQAFHFISEELKQDEDIKKLVE